MTEHVRRGWWQIGPYTVGRRNLKIPALGPVGYFKAQDAPRFFDQFWTLNLHGSLDQYGRAHADLQANPSLILLAEGEKPTVVINGLARVTSEEERDAQKALRTRQGDLETYQTKIKQTSILLGQAEDFTPKPFLKVSESEWVEAEPQATDPVPTTRLLVFHRDDMLRQGETPGAEGDRPEVIAAHRAVYDRAVHAALTETVELLS